MNRIAVCGLTMLIAMVLLERDLAARQTRSKTAISYLERADKELQSGSLDRAISDYGIALQFDPNSAHAYINRGLAEQSREMFDSAIEDFTRAIAVEPTAADAFLDRANTRVVHDDVEGALADYAAAIRLRESYLANKVSGN